MGEFFSIGSYNVFSLITTIVGSQNHQKLGRAMMRVIHTSSCESGVAGLAAKRLDALSMAMLAITYQSVDVSICDPGVRTLTVRTGEALCVYPLRCSPAAFDLAPGADRWRRRLHTRREGAGEATGGAIAWGAWLEKSVDCGVQRHGFRVGRAMMEPIQVPKPCQGKQKEEHEQEQK